MSYFFSEFCLPFGGNLACLKQMRIGWMKFRCIMRGHCYSCMHITRIPER